jgi:hypothetical protein
MQTTDEYGWKKDNRYTNIFYCEKYFGGFKYSVIITVEALSKSVRFWVYTSSGKKRKELEIYGDKINKSLGGIKALFWIKDAVLNFPIFYNIKYDIDDLKAYLCILWSDSRRRDIYARLEKEGFSFMQINGVKTLVKNCKKN